MIPPGSRVQTVVSPAVQATPQFVARRMPFLLFTAIFVFLLRFRLKKLNGGAV
jgi:hypothetical protein